MTGVIALGEWNRPVVVDPEGSRDPPGTVPKVHRAGLVTGTAGCPAARRPKGPGRRISVRADVGPRQDGPREGREGEQRRWRLMGRANRALGRTGVKVSLAGLGGFHIGKQQDEQESIRIIRSALDAGINFLDNSGDTTRARARSGWARSCTMATANGPS